MSKLKSALWGRGALAVPIALAGFFAANAHGTQISLGAALTNASFEMGNQVGADPYVNGCPVGWTCGSGGSPAPGFTSYTVTSSQYTPGADGLVGSLITPDGLMAASSPVPEEGSGVLFQTGLGTYTNGNDYLLGIFIGTPNTVPNIPSVAAGAVGTAALYFLGNGNLLQRYDFVIPQPGQWLFETFDFTPSGPQIGQTIGLELFVSGSGPGITGSTNDLIANFDIASGSLSQPEPSTFLMLGVGLLAFPAFRRFRKKA